MPYIYAYCIINPSSTLLHTLGILPAGYWRDNPVTTNQQEKIVVGGILMFDLINYLLQTVS